MLLLPEKFLHERQLCFYITVKQRGCVVNGNDGFGTDSNGASASCIANVAETV